jgi:DNA-directed RNA polymerase subunit alpha
MEGAAVTAVRVAGAVHEFSAVPNVREDVINILLNLKKLRVKMEDKSREYLHLHASKTGEVKAADIEEIDGVEIINKDLVIATLEAGGSLDMEIEISRGKGYGLSEEMAKITRPAGFIPIDALFSPIVKVHYDVEPARVGQKTDYDRLILEITTDGTLSPAKALHRAAVLLSGSLHIFTIEGENDGVKTVSDQDVEEVAPAVNTAASSVSKQEDLLNQSIEFMELSSRSMNCLKSENIKTVRDLVKMTESDLNMIKNFGAKSMEEIKTRLAEKKLSLGMKI